MTNMTFLRKSNLRVLIDYTIILNFTFKEVLFDNLDLCTYASHIKEYQVAEEIKVNVKLLY